MLYKEDEDGNQSTFNLFVVPKQDSSRKKSILAFIDNENTGEQNWFGDKDLTIKEIFDAFDKWASDAPIVFELDAQKNISNFLKSALGTK